MAAHQLMNEKVTTLTDPLGHTYWRTVSTFDWRTPQDGEDSRFALLRQAKYVEVMGYLNVQGNLASGVFAGGWACRFLRVGTTDDTGLQSQSVLVPPSRAGGTFPAHFASPPWQGANPGGLLLQVRHLPGFFDELKAATRYIKVQWHT